MGRRSVGRVYNIPLLIHAIVETKWFFTRFLFFFQVGKDEIGDQVIYMTITLNTVISIRIILEGEIMPNVFNILIKVKQLW